MTKASDNEYPSLLVKEGTAPASPAAGDQRLFIDSADHLLKRKNSGGTVTTVGGGIADHGAFTYLDATDAAAPANPSAGSHRIYSKTGGLYYRDNAGTEVGPLSAGGGSGGLTLLEQHTASSSATLDFTTGITSTYDDYMIEVVNLIPATDGAEILFRCSTDGGSNYDTGSNYQCQNQRFSHYGTAVESLGGGTSIQINGQGGGGPGVSNTAARGGLSGTFRFFGPLSATAYKFLRGQTIQIFSSEANLAAADIAGVYVSATAVNAFRVVASSGNLASGTIRVYGIAK